MILKRGFYERDILTVARELLGKTVVHETSLGVASGKIVETEAYLGPEDKASHSYGSLRTKRTETQFGAKGHAYIYLIYGMYYCFNVTAGSVAGKPEAVLFRALEPLGGIELMEKLRPCAHGKISELANGPGKLCMAMGLTKRQNNSDLTKKPFYIQDDGVTVADGDIVETTRIGVDYAEDWKQKPWRFYIKDCAYVSVKLKDKG
jgi:DNA-3-methyladenine glycosylase